MQGDSPKTYHDAVYHVKRQQIYIGVTGYTGSGCSTLRKLLTSPDKPALSRLATNGKNGLLPRGDLIHRKLQRVWDGLEWKPFACIEVSKVIFAFACLRMGMPNLQESHISKRLKSIIEGKEAALQPLELLNNSSALDEPNATKLVEAFKLCDTLYRRYQVETLKENQSFAA